MDPYLADVVETFVEGLVTVDDATNSTRSHVCVGDLVPLEYVDYTLSKLKESSLFYVQYLPEYPDRSIVLPKIEVNVKHNLKQIFIKPLIKLLS